MPTYDYRCEATGRIVEVSHKLDEKITTWAELCARAGLEIGTTPKESAVTKLISGSYINGGASAVRSLAPPCTVASAPCCGGMCKTH